MVSARIKKNCFQLCAEYGLVTGHKQDTFYGIEAIEDERRWKKRINVIIAEVTFN
jgi:hypothetical protein